MTSTFLKHAPLNNFKNQKLLSNQKYVNKMHTRKICNLRSQIIIIGNVLCQNPFYCLRFILLQSVGSFYFLLVVN